MTLVELTLSEVQFVLAFSIGGGFVIGLVLGWVVWGRT